MSADARPFHIIIAGGGLVGLSAAHIFQSLSGVLSTPSRPVEFTVLEAHPTVAPYIGSLLLLYPFAFRIYDQLGLLPALRPLVDETRRTVSFRAADGSEIFTEEGLSDLLEKRHGHGFRVCHRPLFAECLYQGLSDKGKGRVLLGKRVVDVQVSDGGVNVICEDGTEVSGDIVIGADGVRSRVRSSLQRHKAEAESPEDVGCEGKGEADEKSPYLATFRLFFGNIPILPGLPECTNWEGAHPGISTQVLTGTKQAWWAVYEQLETPTRERMRYTAEDKQELIDRWGDLYMVPGYTLKDVLKYDSGKTGMINLEEGLVDTWAWNRIALVGDAVRKVEPHAGLGFNQGLTDIVTIANKLFALLESTDSAPSTKDLERIFTEYHKERMETMPTVDRMCRRRARQVAWPSLGFKIYATWILPYFPLARLGAKYVIGPLICKAPVLEWLDEHDLPDHEVEYQHRGSKDPKKRSIAGDSRSQHDHRFRMLTATGIVVSLAAAGWRYYSTLRM